MTEVALSSLTVEHLGKHVREIPGPGDHLRNAVRRNWIPVAGRITSIRHFFDRPQSYTKAGKPTGVKPALMTALVVETGRDDRGVVHREILAPSTQKVDLNL